MPRSYSSAPTNWTGDARYIYHGNDGTSMPWNDTAQLDYLNPEVREAVIQTILHVARQFPIIRFDAAMTLARRHIQRLWFPEPGQGGAIPSRAEHAVSRAEFDERMPAEFWREVVDRVAAEVPDTLLLAEAFWLLEGYFVRTLGMHRVYNSAFMNMLRDEENASYRQVIKDTIEFDPEVLKRFVNFMSNPDERTAVDQFGKDDKYFGVATLMATMPGLPMIGHGQVEGFAEKTAWSTGGRIATRCRTAGSSSATSARSSRSSTAAPVRRDGRLPALRRLRSGRLVNEDVFAYSNRHGDERALVVYHNRFAEAKGWIKTSVAYSVADGGGRRLVQKSLGEGLGLHPDGDWWTLLREQRSGLEFLRRSSDLCRDGLFVELHAYGCQVFLDIHEVEDGPSGSWAAWPLVSRAQECRALPRQCATCNSSHSTTRARTYGKRHSSASGGDRGSSGGSGVSGGSGRGSGLRDLLRRRRRAGRRARHRRASRQLPPARSPGRRPARSNRRRHLPRRRAIPAPPRRNSRPSSTIPEATFCECSGLWST